VRRYETHKFLAAKLIRPILTSPNLPLRARQAPATDRLPDRLDRKTAHDPTATKRDCTLAPVGIGRADIPTTAFPAMQHRDKLHFDRQPDADLWEQFMTGIRRFAASREDSYF
jgi:hypothetical protein